MSFTVHLAGDIKRRLREESRRLDAIAPLALDHNATIHTHDRDLARFPGVRWHNPLTP